VTHPPGLPIRAPVFQCPPVASQKACKRMHGGQGARRLVSCCHRQRDIAHHAGAVTQCRVPRARDPPPSSAPPSFQTSWESRNRSRQHVPTSPCRRRARRRCGGACRRPSWQAPAGRTGQAFMLRLPAAARLMSVHARPCAIVWVADGAACAAASCRQCHKMTRSPRPPESRARGRRARRLRRS